MFFLTTFHIKAEEENDPNYIRTDPRCFGYYADKKIAIQAAEENWGDMHECLYNYLLIEELGEGIHPIPKNVTSHDHERWYRWEGDHDTGKWIRALRPACFKQIILFSIG